MPTNPNSTRTQPPFGRASTKTPAVKPLSVTAAPIGVVIAMMTGCSGSSVATGQSASADTTSDAGPSVPITYAMLPPGSVSFLAQFNAMGTVSQEECNDDYCDNPQYVVISSSAPTSVPVPRLPAKTLERFSPRVPSHWPIPIRRIARTTPWGNATMLWAWSRSGGRSRRR